MLAVYRLPSQTALLMFLMDLCLVLFFFVLFPLSATLCGHTLCIFNGTWMIDFHGLTTRSPVIHLNRLTFCLSALHTRIARNSLAPNDNKSDAIQFGTRAFPSIHSVTTAGSQVPLTQSVSVLVVTFDSVLFLNKQTSICESVCFHLRALRHACLALIEDIQLQHVTLVQSRLLFANSIMFTQTTSISFNASARRKHTGTDCCTKYFDSLLFPLF